jgi:hypothetical protein
MKYPEIIEFPHDRWGAAQILTVADWREARAFAIKGDDKHTLSQFRAATLFIELAEHYGIAETAVLMEQLDKTRPPHHPGGGTVVPIKRRMD